MRKSLLLLLGLTTGWISAYSSNYVLKNGNSDVVLSKTEQTQNLTFNSNTLFGRFVRNEFALANNVQNCDPQRFFNAGAGTCENNQITWNIPFSGDGEALSAGYPRVFDLSTNSVLAVNPNSQPITLPVGNYEIQYRYDGDDYCAIPVTVRDLQTPTFTANCGNTYNYVTNINDCITNIGTNDVAIAEGTDNCTAAASIVVWSVIDILDGEIRDTVAANAGGFLPDSIQLGLGVHTVTFTIVDPSGNTDQCISTITVSDNNVPVFVDNLGAAVDTSDANYADLVGLGALPNDLGLCGATAAFDLPLAIDTCEGPLLVTYEILDASSAVIGAGNGDITDFLFPEGVNTVIVRTTDGTFPIAFSFLVEVLDVEPPVMIDCPVPFSVEFATSNNGIDDCTADVLFPQIAAIDNCNGPIDYNWAFFDKDTINLLNSGINSDATITLEPDTYVVGWFVVDDNGNPSDPCFARFVVVDDEAPKRIGGAPATNQNLLVGPACDVNVNMAIPNVGDNSTGCAVSPIQGGFFQYFTITETATGNLVKRDTVSNALTNVNETFGLGVFTVTWTAEDYSGNTAEIDQFQITVSDDIDPTIDVNVYAGTNTATFNLSNFPADVVNGGCELAVVIPAVTVADNCAIDTVYTNRGFYNLGDQTVVDTLPIGTTTINYTAEDEAGNQVTESITITVVDDIAPTINGAFAFPDLIENTANNKCSFTKSWNVLNYFAPADNCGDELDSLYIVIEDIEMGTVIDFDTLIANEVSEIGANQVINVTFFGPNDSSRVVIRATDLSGNSLEKSFLVVAQDKQLPTISYQDTVRVFVNSVDCNSALAKIEFNDQLVGDNCASDATLLANMTNDFVGGAVKNTGDTLEANFDIEPNPYHTVTFETFDDNGNIRTKAIVVHVIDDIEPGVTLQPLDTLPNDFRVCEATTKVFAPTASDACGIKDVEYSINNSPFMSLPPNEIEFPFTFPVGTSEIVWMVTDSNDNVVLDTQKITIIDAEAPYIEPIVNQNLVTAAGECGRVFDLAFPVVTDNCNLDSAYFTFTDNNGNDTILPNFDDLSIFIEPGNIYTGMVYAVDSVGNRDSISFNVILRDVEAPTMTCPSTDLKIQANDPNCRAVITLMDEFNFDPSDNCDNFTVIGFDGTQFFDPYANHNFPVGFTTVDLTIVDVDGNDFTCTFDVEVKNNIISHVVDFPKDTVLLTTNNECSRRYFWSEPRILGNGCNGETVTYTSSHMPGETFPIDTTVVTYTFERRDGANNLLETYVDSFIVVVQDKQAPVITQIPADRTLSVGANCLATLQYPNIDFQDNCDAQGIIVDITDGLESGSQIGVGVYTVEIKVTDRSGNFADTSFTVTVVDNTAPSLTVPTQTLNVCDVNTDLSQFVTASDNCGLNGAVVFDPATLVPGSQTVKATATDVNGNKTEKTFAVNVIENTVATITSNVPAEVCEGSTWNFTANAPGAGESGMWTSATGSVSIADPSNPSTQITFNNPGTYDVIWTLTNPGCAGSTATTVITVLEDVQAMVAEPTLDASNNEVILNGNEAPGTDKGTWSTANTAANIADVNDHMTLVTNVLAETDFTWTIEIPGCQASSATVKVLVPARDLENEVETGFTPGAASNQYWNLDVVKNEADYANATVKVYNRWGSPVFESTIANYNGAEQWDGTYEGNELPAASYYFVIDPQSSNAKVITGFVTIIK